MRHFNPRARVGRDVGRCLAQVDQEHFNPRARVGRDLTGRITPVNAMISIHAPAWGATSGTFIAVHDLKISIHAPAWGATT